MVLCRHSRLEVTPGFQSWHTFAPSSNTWIPLDHTHFTAGEDAGLTGDSRLVIVSWNVDAFAPASQCQSRVSGIISHLQSLNPPPEIIFLQEVSRSTLLAVSWLQKHWYPSEADTTNWGIRPFASMTLGSKSRIDTTGRATGKAALGPVWRVKFPSRFERDALCCDLSLPSPELDPS